MQEIKYQDGSKSKELFNSFDEAIEDAKKKAQKEPIKELKITLMIPGKKKRRGNENNESAKSC